ncbi:MAG: hypothetical protein QNJ16_09470 [Rhodobacter sp.]|nr:hypothetical protein [Rhodobacter sp.]
MGDFNGIPPFAGSAATRIDTTANRRALPPVEPSLDTRAPADRRTHDHTFARPNDLSDLDENTLTGPPPSFSANVLEMDRTMREAMARIEAAHSRPEAEIAIAVETPVVPGETV